MKLAILILAACIATPPFAFALPQDAGALNVRDFGAKGDGVTDDTAALLAAITASGPDTGDRWWQDRIVYLPAGTYRVSDTLVKRYREGRFASGMALLGDGPGRTIIRLADHAPGFQDRAAPRGIVMTTSKLLDHGGSRDYVHKGEGNDAFENFVENLTIDAGADNPGAIGIDYLASNLGAVRDVVIQAPDGSGAIGIAMLRQVPGPALIQSADIKGFRTGIAIAHSEYGMTLSGITLSGQTETGLRNDGNAVSAERLKITGPGKTGPAKMGIVNDGPGGLITLVDSDVGPIGINRGAIVFRATRAVLAGAQSTSLDGVLQGDAPFQPVSLDWAPPRVTIPSVDAGPSRLWVGVTGSTDQTPVDATRALQSALDSGAPTIYLRQGTFWISAPLHVPASVHRIIGMNSTLRVFPQRKPGFTLDDPFFLIDQPGGPLQIERMSMDNSNQGAQLGVRHASNRTLLLRDIVSAGVTLLDRAAQGGPTAVENVCCGQMQVAGPAPVTARQFDTEGGGVRVENAGAPLSIIGLKTELESTVVRTTAGGRTDILGGLVYMVVAPSYHVPMFISQNAQFTASFVEEVLQRGHGYQIVLRDEAGGRVEDIAADTMRARGLGHIVGTLSTRAK